MQDSFGTLLAAIITGGIILFFLLWLWFWFEQRNQPVWPQDQTGYSDQYNGDGYRFGNYGYGAFQPAYRPVYRVRRHVHHHPCYVRCNYCVPC